MIQCDGYLILSDHSLGAAAFWGVMCGAWEITGFMPDCGLLMYNCDFSILCSHGSLVAGSLLPGVCCEGDVLMFLFRLHLYLVCFQLWCGRSCLMLYCLLYLCETCYWLFSLHCMIYYVFIIVSIIMLPLVRHRQSHLVVFFCLT
jgi:hypothetical protein